MKNYIYINKLFKHIKKSHVGTWLDKLSFFNILITWIVVVTMFGVYYYYFNSTQSYLLYNISDIPVTEIKDFIYYSFVTATTTGFGDIIPIGFFKVLSVFEVIFGLMLLALVTSKLVSIKQDIILNEMYDISIGEKINRLRSSLLLFRQNMERMILKIDEKNIKKRELNTLYLYLSSLEDTLNEINMLYARTNKNHFIKDIDPVNTQILFNSVSSSFEKFNELVIHMSDDEIDWKTEINKDLLNKCIDKTDMLFFSLHSYDKLMKDTINDIISRKDQIFKQIKNNMMR